jgi:hypothetical protein
VNFREKDRKAKAMVHRAVRERLNSSTTQGCQLAIPTATLDDDEGRRNSKNQSTKSRNTRMMMRSKHTNKIEFKVVSREFGVDGSV